MTDPASDSNKTLRFYMAMFGGLHGGHARRLTICPGLGGATLGGRPDEGQPLGFTLGNHTLALAFPPGQA